MLAELSTTSHSDPTNAPDAGARGIYDAQPSTVVYIGAWPSVRQVFMEDYSYYLAEAAGVLLEEHRLEWLALHDDPRSIRRRRFERVVAGEVDQPDVVAPLSVPAAPEP